MSGNQRLNSVVLDEDSLAAASRDQEQERQIAIFDLLEDNFFAPDGAEGGPYDLRIALIDNRLALDITGPGYQRRHILSLSPFRSVVRDYAMICASSASRRSIWGAAACTMKARPCCANGWPARWRPIWTPPGGFSP